MKDSIEFKTRRYVALEQSLEKIVFIKKYLTEKDSMLNIHDVVAYQNSIRWLNDLEETYKDKLHRCVGRARSKDRFKKIFFFLIVPIICFFLIAYNVFDRPFSQQFVFIPVFLILSISAIYYFMKTKIDASFIVMAYFVVIAVLYSIKAVSQFVDSNINIFTIASLIVSLIPLLTRDERNMT